MSAILYRFNEELRKEAIFLEIESHPAWIGHVAGLEAEKMMRGKNTPFLFVLRAGEKENHYYATFTLPDNSVKHQPFVIWTTPEGWHYENGGPAGPFISASINDVLHFIMHCSKGECVPYIKQ